LSNQEEAAAILQAAKEQLAEARNGYFQATHNTEAVINNVEKSITLLVDGQKVGAGHE